MEGFRARGRIAKWCLFAVRVIIVDGLAILGGAAAVLLTAGLTSRPAWLLIAGVVTMTGVLAGALLIAVPRRGSRRSRHAFAGTAIVVAAAVLGATVIPAVPGTRRATSGSMYWDLPTGSRLQYLRSPAKAGTAQGKPPVIFLHGGPGVADLDSDLRHFASVTAWGHDLYVYAQLGAGDSSRLADPRGYGRSRDVDDLEAIRQRLGAAEVILIGHSYGGGLAAAYAARYPKRVAKLVLISPMPLDPDDHSSNGVRKRLTTWQALRLYRGVASPRSLMVYLLLQVEPSAAHAFMGDREADSRNDDVLAVTEPALHCTDTGPHPTTSQSGFYALQYPQSAGAARPADLRAPLQAVSAPTLIVKGACDYLSWSSAIDYRRSLRHTSLLYLRGAGHNAYQDRPEEVLEAVHELLTDQAISNRYEGFEPPSDYQGPVSASP